MESDKNMLSEFYNHTICFPCFEGILYNFILFCDLGFSLWSDFVLIPTLISFYFHLPVPGLECITGPLEEIALHDHTIGCIHIEFQFGVIVGKVLHREHICRKFVVRVEFIVNIYFPGTYAHCFNLKTMKTAKFWWFKLYSFDRVLEAVEVIFIGFIFLKSDSLWKNQLFFCNNS